MASVHASAPWLGLELAAAEVGPQLRLQYFDQPIGEFLITGMDPIMRWSGEPIILNVANGGADPDRAGWSTPGEFTRHISFHFGLTPSTGNRHRSLRISRCITAAVTSRKLTSSSGDYLFLDLKSCS
ncbi:hypothetical protein [Bradyrhizobium sp. BR13661]|uniref:hypothetical protein n=1 Tax=Bradyrhizobium sp. BR13661 TaxID=2940622 RepID=UPI0024767FBB|nr:hypothetical protein [Bradyrhizobium sp. BR13661]MDH6263365.1 hypothetical protein [Bradyrhizobium sp. BR13661]